MEQTFCVHCMEPLMDGVCGKCGENNSTYHPLPHHLQPGTILNEKYLIGAVLGEGGFGITYIGRDINLDLKIAIKEYYPSGIVNRNNTFSNDVTVTVGDTQALYEKGKNNFQTEARTLAKFAMEPSVVSVRDHFSLNNTAYIVMDYLEGMDLKAYVAKHGQMTFSEMFTILAPIMVALGKIHAHGLIHRDISPANIMVLGDGTAKLLDFGAAREFSNDEKSLSIMLKPGYAPEEQYRSKGHQGPWTDVYALSATIYKMLTGVTPDDSMNRLFSDDLRKITELNSSITEEQQEVIFKGMAVKQADRYQTIEELYRACESLEKNFEYVGNKEQKVVPEQKNATFCVKCGGKLQEGASFCTICGAERVFVKPQTSKNVERKTVGVFDVFSNDEISIPMNSQSEDMTPQETQLQGIQSSNKTVSFGEAIKLFFANYVNCSGRATRSEYWWSILFSTIISIVLLFFLVVMPIIGLIGFVALLIPQISLAIRRLHDIGKPGTYYLFMLLPLVGWILLIVLYCQSSDGDNQWGRRKI